MINLTKNEEQLTNEVMGKINLSKDKEKLGGTVVNLSKTIVNLSKKSDVDLGSTKAQVVVVVDHSGSMHSMYTNGTVQRVLDKMVPLGLTFDDNGEVEVYRFDNFYKELKSMNINNYSDYSDKVLFNRADMGGTNYAPVLNRINEVYLGGKNKKKGLFGFLKKDTEETVKDAEVPVFVIFITDGDNSDKEDTNEIIRELSNKNCFVQFIGVGKASMSYLEKLDDLDGRSCDNTGFVRFKDIDKVSEEELYTKTLEQFADWLKVRGF